MDTKLKRISYHLGTKTVAFLLAVIAFGCLVTYGLDLVGKTEDISVLFAKDFISSEGAYDVFRSTAYNAQQFVTTDNPSEQQRVKTRLDAIAGVYCYAKDSDVVVTNSGYTSMEQFTSQKYYYLYTSEGRPEGESALSASIEADWVYRGFLNTHEFYFAFDDEFIMQKQAEFEQSKDILKKGISVLGAILLAGILALVYLIIVTGKNHEGKIKLIGVDRLWTDVSLALIIAVSIGYAILLGVLVLDAPNVIYEVVTDFSFGITLISALVGSLVLMLFLSLCRHIKNKTLIRHSFTGTILRFILRGAKLFLKKTVDVFKTVLNFTPMNIKIVGAILSTALFSFIATALLWESSGTIWFISLFIMLLGIIGVSYIFIKFVIKPYDDEVSARLKSALAKEVRAEGLKTELITNVSHDLKTPITAILNYSDLLIKEDANNEHAIIIYEKAQKLRTLTEDLFEVSKAQSGNLNINKENLNISELIEQTLAEFDGHSVLFRVNTKGISMLADSRLMGRVFENLVGNIIKYSLPGTRAYIDAFEKDDKTYITFKNIANYEMNFDINEMTERFSRGDQSRGTDGNGLGLAIAQSYTEACGGNLLIEVDGDLFKVIISF